MKKILLAYRKYKGVGDWIMAMSVLKMVNRQYPDIDIWINMLARNFMNGEKSPSKLPQLAEDVVRSFDVQIQRHVYFSHPENHRKWFDYVSGHMVYDRHSGKFFIESMVDEFNKNTGLKLKYELGIYSVYRGEYSSVSLPFPYVLIQACSKKRENESIGKDYGFSNMSIIAEILSKVVNVVQIGLEEDPILPAISEHYLSKGISVLHSLMVNSQGFVGLDGALGVYAAVHSVPQHIIYHGNFNPNWTKFPLRRQYNGNLYEVEEIANFIAENCIRERIS